MDTVWKNSSGAWFCVTDCINLLPDSNTSFPGYACVRYCGSNRSISLIVFSAYLWKFFMIVSSSSATEPVPKTSFMTSRTAFLSLSDTRTRSSIRSFSTNAFLVMKLMISSSLLLFRLTDAPFTVNARSPRLKSRATSQCTSSSTNPYGAFMKRSFTVFMEVFICIWLFPAMKASTSSSAC